MGCTCSYAWPAGDGPAEALNALDVKSMVFFHTVLLTLQEKGLIEELCSVSVGSSIISSNLLWRSATT